MPKIIIGAPSLGGKGAKDIITEAFGGAPFPKKFQFTNLVWFSQNYPEIALHLKGSGHGDETMSVREINDLDTLVRVSTSIEILAGINDSQDFMEISDEFGELLADADAGDGDNETRDGDQTGDAGTGSSGDAGDTSGAESVLDNPADAAVAAKPKKAK